jgi:hypothetical protein
MSYGRLNRAWGRLWACDNLVQLSSNTSYSSSFPDARSVGPRPVHSPGLPLDVASTLLRVLHVSTAVQIALGNAAGSSCVGAMASAVCPPTTGTCTKGAQCTNGADTPIFESSSSVDRPRWAGSSKSKQVTWAFVANIDPDVLIVCGCGFDLARNRKDAAPIFRQDPEASQLRALKEGRVFALDGNRTLSRPGPCLLEGTAAVAACVWYDDRVRRAALAATGCLPLEGEVWGKLEV